MDMTQYELAANNLRVANEDAQVQETSRDTALVALIRTFETLYDTGHQVDEEFVADLARDDATLILNFESALRPILEALWRNDA